MPFIVDELQDEMGWIGALVPVDGENLNTEDGENLFCEHNESILA
jgi:hypothetical protein